MNTDEVISIKLSHRDANVMLRALANARDSDRTTEDELSVIDYLAQRIRVAMGPS